MRMIRRCASRSGRSIATRSEGSGRRRPSSNGTTTCPPGRRCSAKRAGPSVRWAQRSGEQRSLRMPFESTVAAFAAALCEPAAPPPAATRGRQGAPDGRRFAVYRNNVAVGLIGAIEARYPVTRRILGEQAFRGLARAYVQAEKPGSPVLSAYGGSFPEFIAGSCEKLGPPYLADVARLE